GAQALAARHSFSSPLFIVLLLLIPAAGLLARRVLVVRLGSDEDPERLKQLNAFKTAMLKLESLEKNPSISGPSLVENVRDVVCSYLPDRLRMRVQSLTPDETLSRVEEQIEDSSARERLATYLGRIEGYLYSGRSGAGDANDKTLVKDAANIVRTIEDTLQGT